MLNNNRLARRGSYRTKEQIVGGGGLARPALGFCATVTPSPSGSVALSGWSHRLSILVGTDERTNEGTFRLQSASCERRWKRSDDPPLPSLCQFFCTPIIMLA